MKVFRSPLKNIDPYFIVWFLFVIITIIPGTLLFVLSLFTFNYFGMTDELSKYLAKKSIEREYEQNSA